MKICNCCKINKEDTEFKPKKLRSGNMSISSQCRACLNNKANAKYAGESEEERLIRKNRVKEYNANNRPLINALKRKYNLRDKIDRINSVKHEHHVKLYIKAVSDRMKKCDQHVKEWYGNLKVYAQWKQKHDMSYVVYQRLKRGIRRCIKNYDGRVNWLSILGYTSHDLKKSIESKFVDGMSWDNRHEWHIDHKFPLCAVDVQSHNDENFIKLFCLDNLRPLWIHQNRVKYHSYDKHLRTNFGGAYLDF